MKTLNLCDLCINDYPDCNSTYEGMRYGDGIGMDNVVSCSAYKTGVYDAIRKAREKAGISQNRLGKLANVPNRNISYWESGKGDPPISACIKIAKVLGITIDELVGVKA